MRADKILFLGNSITACGPKYWGLAASTAEKDYAHLLAADISAKTGSRLTMIPTTAPVTRPDGSVDVGKSNVINIADILERGYRTYEPAKIARQIAWKADIVVLQFGENIPMASFDAAKFKSGLQKLVANLKESSNPQIFAAGYILGANPTVENIKRQICAEDPAHRVFVDLSAVGRDRANIGDYGHPNDKGMALIADLMFKAIVAHLASK
jgi:lysophospholipase L1-like esterase